MACLLGLAKMKRWCIMENWKLEREKKMEKEERKRRMNWWIRDSLRARVKVKYRTQQSEINAIGKKRVVAAHSKHET